MSPVVHGSVKSTMSSTPRAAALPALCDRCDYHLPQTGIVAVSLAICGRATVGSRPRSPDLPRHSGFLRRQHDQPGVDLVVRGLGRVIGPPGSTTWIPAVRREYIEDVFEVPTGSASRGTSDRPVSTTSSATTRWRRSHRLLPQRAEQRGAGRFPLYACRCSQSDVARRASGDGMAPTRAWEPACDSAPMDRRQSSAAARPSGAVRHGDDPRTTRLDHRIVVWRREGSPAYHWASIIGDRDLGTNSSVVRGRPAAIDRSTDLPGRLRRRRRLSARPDSSTGRMLTVRF